MGGQTALWGLVSAAAGEDEAVSPASPVGAASPSWQAIRKQFRVRRGLAYLNNGSLGPCPEPVVRCVIDEWRKLEENPAVKAFGPAIGRMEQVRAAAASFLGCDPDELAVTNNTTEGMNAVAQGMDLHKGDRVLTTDQEHPGGSVCWQYFAQHRGVQIDRVPLSRLPHDSDRIVQSFSDGLEKPTAVVSVSHVTFTTGQRLPIRRIANLARDRGALMIVDGAQAPGVLDVDVRALGCDAYAASGHKWMLAPKGTGLLFIRRGAQDRIRPMLLHNGYGSYTAATGTRNFPAIIGLGAAIGFLEGIGKPLIEARALHLRDRLYRGLTGIRRIRILSPPPGEMTSAMVSFVLPDPMDNAALAATLRHKDGVIVKVVPGLKGIRVSTHVYNQEDETERLLAALRREMG